MNWIERMYEIKGKDLYSQNGEGLYLEYILYSLGIEIADCIDIGGGDGFYLSNTYHLLKGGNLRQVFDRENGQDVNLISLSEYVRGAGWDLISVDIDGNDYWVIEKILTSNDPKILIAEFNASYTDSRTIKYNPDHVWAGDSYYGFTFEAGVKLAEKHGYKVIFQIADMNMIMVRADLIEGLYIPPVTYTPSSFFQLSERTDWVFI